MAIFIFWIVLSALIGSAGKDRKIGGATAFFVSLLLSPLIGLIALLTSDKLNVVAAEPPTPHSVADELQKLKKLHDDGALTAEEYAAQKSRLLN